MTYFYSFKRHSNLMLKSWAHPSIQIPKSTFQLQNPVHCFCCFLIWHLQCLTCWPLPTLKVLFYFLNPLKVLSGLIWHFLHGPILRSSSVYTLTFFLQAFLPFLFFLFLIHFFIPKISYFSVPTPKCAWFLEWDINKKNKKSAVVQLGVFGEYRQDNMHH